MQGIAILGSTGSIGQQCLQVIAQLAERLKVVALAAGENIEALAAQVVRFRPSLVSVASEAAVPVLRERLAALGVPAPDILWGREGLNAAATHPDARIVVSAIVGIAGLEATYRAVTARKRLALANKESLVVAGALLTRAAQAAGVEILPVDSEHNAAHQCLRAGARGEIKRLILTASGGPFRTWPRKKLERVTPQQALKHPNWRMGKRITIDSATLMNKGFEIIEARWLFGLRPEQIEVVIHPQSRVHSLVEFVDGSVVAQLAPPDMRLPIRYALTYPERVPTNEHQLDWSTTQKLDFRPLDLKKFRCLSLARQALEAGGSLPCVLNAADEVAVNGFLQRRIRFTQIPELIDRVLGASACVELNSIEEVRACDREARGYAERVLSQLERDRRRARG